MAHKFRSELLVPIKKDEKSFEERQRSLWDDMNSDSLFSDMHERMERQRKEWEAQVGGMRKDLFRLKPQENRTGSSENLLESMDLNDIFQDRRGSSGKEEKKFQVSFDVSQFQPEEISVRTEEQKLIVNAKSDGKASGSSVSREFSRQIDIPKHVDPLKLSSTLSKDGILQVEAPVAAPDYHKIKSAPDYGHIKLADPFRGEISLGRHGSPLLHSAVPDHKSGSLMKQEDGSSQLKMEIPIGPEYKPEDLDIKTIDRKVVVKARHEEKAHGRTSVQEFNKEFDLPADIDPNTVVASMTDDGKVIIEAQVMSYQKGSYQGKPGSTKQPGVSVHIS